MPPRIQLPDYVYRNLKLYGNSALPNVKYSKQQLIDHLSYKMKRYVHIRKAIFTNYIEHGTEAKGIETYYYVAEFR